MSDERVARVSMVASEAKGRLRLDVLGHFHLSADGQDIALKSRKAKALLGYLAVVPGGGASREKLAGLLWGDSSEAQARGSLRQCLNEIYHALGPASGILSADRQEIHLTKGEVFVDAAALLELTRAASLEEKRQVTGLYRTELLDGLGSVDRAFDAWLLEERAHWRELVERTLESALEAYLATGKATEALETGQALLRLDPAREDVHRKVMRLLADQGQRSLALRQYEACRSALRLAFDARPSAETERLAEFIKHFPSNTPAAAGGAKRRSPFDRQADADGRETPAPRTPAPCLAVLPFDNLSRDADLDYFSDGVSEEILHLVARLPRLKVIGRSTSFQFRGGAKAPASIPDELGVTHLLDGSVRRSGERVRILANLTDRASQTGVWSARYERDLADVFAVQDEIAASVAEALELVFAPAKPRKVVPEAHDLLLRARALAGGPAGNQECLDLLQRAVELAPDFATAWASLAMAQAVEARWRTPPEAFAAARERAIESANRAIALDPSAGLSHVPLSLLAPPAAYAEQEEILKRALALTPWEPELLKHAADFEFSVGRMREGYRLIARAHETDPFNRIIANNFAMALGDIGFMRESEDAFAAARARWPDFDWPVSTPLVRAALLRDWVTVEPLLALAKTSSDEAMRMSLTAIALLREPPETARAKLRARAERQLAATGSVELRVIFYTYAVGFPDDAFEILERASFDHLRAKDGRAPDTIFLPGLIFSVVNAQMRRDPRFMDLCAKLGLCDYWVEADQWPDCAAEVGADYDFKARARALAARRPEEVTRADA